MVKNAPRTMDATESARLLVCLRQESGRVYNEMSRVRNFLMGVLMLDTGIRVGELVKLKMYDLYFGDHPVSNLVISAATSKTNKERVIPVSERLYRAILEMHNRCWTRYREHANNYAFFFDLPREPLSVRQVERIIVQAGLTATGRKITPHTLRHTFATNLMRKVPTPVVQALLGHARLSSTQVYQHPNHQDLKNAIDSL